MEQHPVPQNISSYQFHLVGDMTLKQFLELAGGILVGVIIYATGLPGIIKWPLILFAGGLGAALAFVPLEERPLEQWIFAFFRSVYSPTLFHWEKKDNVKYFQDETADTSTAETQTQNTTTSKIPFLSKLEEGENSYLGKLTGLFGPQPIQTQQVSPVQSIQQPVQTQTVQQPQVIANIANTVNTVTTPIQNNVPGNILTMHGDTAINTNISTSTTEVAGQRQIAVPEKTFISVNTQQSRPQVIVQEVNTQQTPMQTTAVGQTLGTKTIQDAQDAMFSPDAAHPSMPTIVNTVSGQVVDHDRKIIEGAILEILDESGRPVRALRSNRAGHFLIVTPLTDGKYKIVTEKEGYNFDPIAFEATGQIIEPIAINAK
jgi:hypothetical protein